MFSFSVCFLIYSCWHVSPNWTRGPPVLFMLLFNFVFKHGVGHNDPEHAVASITWGSSKGGGEKGKGKGTVEGQNDENPGALPDSDWRLWELWGLNCWCMFLILNVYIFSLLSMSGVLQDAAPAGTSGGLSWGAATCIVFPLALTFVWGEISSNIMQWPCIWEHVSLLSVCNVLAMF